MENGPVRGSAAALGVEEDEEAEAGFEEVPDFALVWAGARTLDKHKAAKRNRVAREDKTFIGSWPSWVSNENCG
jgi:hypothetical protein